MPGFFFNYQRELKPVMHKGQEYFLEFENVRGAYYDIRTTHSTFVVKEKISDLRVPISLLHSCVVDHSYHRMATLKQNKIMEATPGCENKYFNFTIKGVHVLLCIIDETYLLAEVTTPEYGTVTEETKAAYELMCQGATKIYKAQRNSRSSTAALMARVLNAASPGLFSKKTLTDSASIETTLTVYKRQQEACAALKRQYLQTVEQHADLGQNSTLQRLKKALNSKAEKAARVERAAKVAQLFKEEPNLEKVVEALLKDTATGLISSKFVKSGILGSYMSQIDPNSVLHTRYKAIMKAKSPEGQPPNNLAAYKKACKQTRADHTSVPNPGTTEKKAPQRH